MTLWLVFAVMTAAAIFAVLWPLGRRKPLREGNDVAVYRDQLDEIGRDRSAGLIGEAEAAAARIEVSRRLLAAVDVAAAEKPAPEAAAGRRRQVTAIVGLVLLPIGAVLLYLALGSPDLPGQPVATRTTAPNDHSIETMVAQVENHLLQNPDDGRAWEVLAPVYMRIGRYDDAAKAWSNSIRLNGSPEVGEAEYGQALVAAANGVVPADAKAAFERALKLDKDDVMARYFMGMAADQDGRRADADKNWGGLLATAPPGAPWVETVRHALNRDIAAATSEPSASGAAPEHDANIEAMVARLADQLKKDGSNVQGWVQLVRSYRTLGQNDKAEVALADARTALAGDTDKLNQLSAGVDGRATEAEPPAPIVPPTSGPAGPSAADIAAAAQMKPEDQNQMIRGMVARLADKLKQDGSDVDGWQRLLRRYMVLGGKDRAP